MGAIDLDTVTIQPETRALVSPTIAEIYRILPLRLENDGRDLVVAASDLSLNALDDLRFMLARRIVTVEAEPEKIEAAIKRCYQDTWRQDMLESLRQEGRQLIEELNSRGVLADVRGWPRRAWITIRALLAHLAGRRVQSWSCPSDVRCANHLLLAAIIDGARESFVEHSRRSGLFRMVKPGGEVEEFPLPPKIARRVARRIVHMARIGRRGSEGTIEIALCGERFTAAVTRERTHDGDRPPARLRRAPFGASAKEGERVTFRIRKQPTPE